MPSLAKDALQWFERESDLPQVGRNSLFMNSPLLVCLVLGEHKSFTTLKFLVLVL